MSRESIALQAVSIGYRSSRGNRVVASNITARIYGGELTCLLGSNGIGKSTLLRTLSNFQPPLGGTIVIDGRSHDSYSSLELARKVGVVLTERPDIQQMTVRDLVALGRAPYTGFWGRLGADDEHVVDESLALVGIAPLSRRQVTTLSDGERQKALIAKALAQQTHIIFLDEPTAFLDYPSKVDTLLLLRRLCREQQKTVFLSTHDVELAIQVADRLWLMQGNDRGVAIGSPEELAASGALANFVEQGGGVHFDARSLSVKVTRS